MGVGGRKRAPYRSPWGVLAVSVHVVLPIGFVFATGCGIIVTVNDGDVASKASGAVVRFVIGPVRE